MRQPIDAAAETVLLPFASSRTSPEPDINEVEAVREAHLDFGPMGIGMDAHRIDDLQGRRAWLERAEADLAARLKQRFGACADIPSASDPLYQRMSHALERVRNDLSRMNAELATGADRFARMARGRSRNMERPTREEHPMS